MPRLTARSQTASRRQKHVLLDHRDLALSGGTLVDFFLLSLLRRFTAAIASHPAAWSGTEGLERTGHDLLPFGSKADGINPSHRSHVDGGRWPLPCPSLQASLQSPICSFRCSVPAIRHLSGRHAVTAPERDYPECIRPLSLLLVWIALFLVDQGHCSYRQSDFCT